MNYKSYFRFTRRDLTGIVSLLLIMGLLLAGPVLLHLLLNGQAVALNYTDIKFAGQKYPDTMVKFTNGEKTGFKDYNSRLPGKFDPNIATAANWSSSGLLPYKIKIILHYLKKGGHFYRATDLEKIYSLNDTDYQRVEPLLLFGKNKPEYAHTRREFSRNRADNNSSETGNNRLPQKSGTKISLNNAGYEELKVLRQLSYANIRDILKYRERNGNFTSLGELKNIGILSSQTFARVKPFLTL